MRMTNQNRVVRVLILGLFEQRFQLSRGPIDEQTFDAACHYWGPA
jgi:hypothetical protein